jgi:hypothetical protein
MAQQILLIQKISNNAVKAKMMTALAALCVSNMHAFEALAGKAFKSILQTVLGIDWGCILWAH